LAVPSWFPQESEFSFRSPQGNELILFWLELGALMGLPVGLGQGLVLRSYLRNSHPWLWTLASTVGAAVGLALFFLVQRLLLHRTYSFLFSNRMYLESSLIFGATGGVISGFAQWLVLSRRSIRKALWWIPASALGWAVSWLITSV